MAKKKKEEKNEETPLKKTIEKKEVEVVKDVEEFPISVLIEKNDITALNAVGFLNYYGLGEEFQKEFITGKSDIKFSEEEFKNMYEKYIEREI